MLNINENNKVYIGETLDNLVNGGSGNNNQSTTGIFVGYISNTDTSLPKKRLNGDNLENEDYVLVSSNATLPFTLNGITFITKKDKAIYLKNTNTWYLSPGSLQTTIETPTTSTDESLSGNASNQQEVNIEVSNKIKNDLIANIEQTYNNNNYSINLVAKNKEGLEIINNTLDLSGNIVNTIEKDNASNTQFATVKAIVDFIDNNNIQYIIEVESLPDVDINNNAIYKLKIAENKYKLYYYNGVEYIEIIDNKQLETELLKKQDIFAYRGVFNDIASAKYILADTLANKDIILVITDNQYYQYHSADNTFTVVDDINIINNLKSKQDILSNTDDVRIKDNISVLKDETGSDITDAEGNVIKEVKKNIITPKFLGIYKDNTSIENYKNGDIIYNNGTQNYQSFNEKTSSWENFNDLRTLQSIKSYQTAIRIPENSPLQFSRRLKEGSAVELEEVLTASFTRYRYDLEYKTYDEVVALPKTQKHNGDIFKLKDNSILLYVCESTVDENYNVTETETYHYIVDNRKTTYTPTDCLKPYNNQWGLNFNNDFGVWMKNNRVEFNGYVSIQDHPSILGGFNNVFKIDTSKFKEGWIVDSSEFVNETIRRDSNIILLTNNTYYSCTYTMNIIDNKGAVRIKIFFTAAVANSMNSYNGGFNFCNFCIPLTKA